MLRKTLSFLVLALLLASAPVTLAQEGLSDEFLSVFCVGEAGLPWGPESPYLLRLPEEDPCVEAGYPIGLLDAVQFWGSENLPNAEAFGQDGKVRGITWAEAVELGEPYRGGSVWRVSGLETVGADLAPAVGFEQEAVVELGCSDIVANTPLVVSLADITKNLNVRSAQSLTATVVGSMPHEFRFTTSADATEDAAGNCWITVGENQYAVAYFTPEEVWYIIPDLWYTGVRNIIIDSGELPELVLGDTDVVVYVEPWTPGCNGSAESPLCNPGRSVLLAWGDLPTFIAEGDVNFPKVTGANALAWPNGSIVWPKCHAAATTEGDSICAIGLTTDNEWVAVRVDHGLAWIPSLSVEITEAIPEVYIYDLPTQ